MTGNCIGTAPVDLFGTVYWTVDCTVYCAVCSTVYCQGSLGPSHPRAQLSGMRIVCTAVALPLLHDKAGQTAIGKRQHVSTTSNSDSISKSGGENLVRDQTKYSMKVRTTAASLRHQVVLLFW